MRLFFGRKVKKLPRILTGESIFRRAFGKFHDFRFLFAEDDGHFHGGAEKSWNF